MWGQATGTVGHPGAPLQPQGCRRDTLGAGFSVAIKNFPMEIKTLKDLQVLKDPSKSLLFFHNPNSSVLT